MRITIDQAREMLADSHPTEEEEAAFDRAAYAVEHKFRRRALAARRIVEILRGSGVELPDDVEVVP